MTHDELLEMIDKQEFTIVYEDHKSEFEILRLFGFRKALRAVVELHSYILYKNTETDEMYEQCHECSGNGYHALYPCPTIRAITEQLTPVTPCYFCQGSLLLQSDEECACANGVCQCKSCKKG